MNNSRPRFMDFLGDSPGQPRILFPSQQSVYDEIVLPWPGPESNLPRIFGLCCGRRWGKTIMDETLIWKGLLAPNDKYGRPPVVQVTADTEDHIMKVWRPFISHIQNSELSALIANYDREFEIVTLHTGATAQMLSSYNPQAMASSGVTLWVVDEAQYISQAAYDNMRPTISDRGGTIVMTGVAQGEGPFKMVCARGDDPLRTEYRHLTRPTASNPFIDPSEIEAAKKDLNPYLFAQLYLAEWQSELGKVFWNVQGCIDDRPATRHAKGWGYTELPKPGHIYYGGLDLARLQDYTVYTIWDRNDRLVAWDRYNMVSWELQRSRIMEFSAFFGHPLTVVDSTGLGDPVFESLLERGFNGMEYKISSNQARRQLIDELAVRIGAGELRYPRIQTFINELSRMEAKAPENGGTLIKYVSPSDEHDDWVISAALAQQVIPRAPQHLVKPAKDIVSLAEEILEDRQIGAYEMI